MQHWLLFLPITDIGIVELGYKACYILAIIYGGYMHCCRCGGVDYSKAGITKGKQRYRCRECGYHFTNTHGRGYPPEMQLKALQLYSENMGLRSIARILKVDPATVMHWIRA